MDGTTLVFLAVGAVGVLVLAAALLGGEFLHLDVDGGAGPWSIEALAGFAGVFGFAGAITHELAGRTAAAAAAAAAVGTAAALPAAYLAVRLSRAARTMPTDATPTRTDLLGSVGVVVTPIPARGYGEVRVRLGGQPVKLNARADQPIGMGAHVFVIEAPTETSVVVEETTPPPTS